MQRGEIRWYRFSKPDKLRPVLILTRDSALEFLAEATIAPITPTVRDNPVAGRSYAGRWHAEGVCGQSRPPADDFKRPYRGSHRDPGAPEDGRGQVSPPLRPGLLIESRMPYS
jgi:hypothetical protein